MRQRTIIRAVATGAAGAAALLGATACGNGDSPEAQSKAVVATYDQFSAAIGNKDGDKAAGLLANTSLNYFDGLRNSALDDDKAALTKRDVLDQLTVMSFRDHLPAATLRTAAPKALVSAAVKTDAITGGSSPQHPLEQVKVSGNTATAVLKLGAQDNTTTQTISFDREGGAWKFDLTSLFGPARAQLASIEKSANLSTGELVKKVSLDRYGKEKTDQLYQPIGRS